ncbi:MAG: acyl-CoA desaturase [Bacteroidota bacterium]
MTNSVLNLDQSEHTVKQQIPLRFNHKDQRDFYPELRRRVNQYFEENQLSKHYNGQMVAKTVLILSLYALTYALLLSNWFGPWVLLLLAMTHGFLTAMIGLNIAHDAVHGAYTSGTRWNKWIGLSFNMIGANDFMWKCSHNGMHHSHTNIVHYDVDIDQIPLIRLNPHQDLWWIHRFQYIYIFFFYALTSLAWVFARDFIEFFHPKVNGKGKTEQPALEFARMVFFKCIYYTVFLVIPFLVIDVPWHYFVIGFIVMHVVEGLTLALIFQLAHVIEATIFPLPDQKGKLEHSWAAHQLYTTVNFGCKNDWLNYICGGLNFQVEHHLFPTICHVHYKHIAPIVEQTAKEFNLPYHNYPTYTDALKSHVQILKQFGKA